MGEGLSWIKKGKIFSTDASLPWSQTHTALPTPYLIDENTLRIYYTTRDSESRSRISFIDVNPENPSEILHIHKEPVIDLGDLGMFDDRGLTSSQIIPVNNQLYFYYNGYNIGSPARYRIAIGLAISDTRGKEFQKISKGPIMDRSFQNPCGSATPFIIKEDEIYRMWYASFVKWEMIDGDAEPYYRIGYAESKDAVHWEAKDIVCIDFNEDEGGIVNPCVIKIEDTYHLWFSVRKNTGYRSNLNSSYRIGYATSKDGINWNRKDEFSGITVSEEGWDSEMTSYPNIIRIKNKIYMFYNGNGFGQSGFGYAVSEINE